jgi:hypothetical protein
VVVIGDVPEYCRSATVGKISEVQERSILYRNRSRPARHVSGAGSSFILPLFLPFGNRFFHPSSLVLSEFFEKKLMNLYAKYIYTRVLKT